MSTCIPPRDQATDRRASAGSAPRPKSGAFDRHPIDHNLNTLTPVKTGCPSQDRRIEHEVNKRLEDHIHFRGRRQTIFARSEGGQLVLSGRLPSFYLKQLLQAALQGIEGVQRIENRVDVVSRVGLSSTRTGIKDCK